MRVRAIDEQRKPQLGLGLGTALIAMLVVLLGAVLVTSAGQPKPREGAASVLMGAYLLAWGVMFLCAYFFSHKTFFFRALMWTCEHWSVPKGRKMAFFYAALASALGLAALGTGLGLW